LKKNLKKKEKLFSALTNKLKFRIQNKKIYFSQLSENEFCINFIFLMINTSKNLRLPIRKNINFGFNYNVLKIKKGKYLKIKLFNILKGLYLYNIEKEKNLINLSYNLQNKFQKSIIFKSYAALLNIRINILLRKNCQNFMKKLFLIRFYFNKYKNQALKTKINILKNKFNQNSLKNMFERLINNKNISLKKRGFFIPSKLKNSKIINNININFPNIENRNDSSNNTTTNKNIKEIINNIECRDENKNISEIKILENKGYDLYYSTENINNNKNDFSSDKNKINTHSYSHSIVSLSNSLFVNGENMNSNEDNQKNYLNGTKNEKKINLKIYEDQENIKGEKIELKDLTSKFKNNSSSDMNSNELIICGNRRRSNLNSLRLISVKYIFNFIKNTMFIKIKLKYFHRLKIKKAKKDFLKNLRILCIKSLVTQAIIEKYNILKRKLLITCLIKCSYNKRRIEIYRDANSNKIKKITFLALRNLKSQNARLIISKVKFCIKLLFLKLRSIKKAKYIKNNLEELKKKKFYLKTFTKIIKLIKIIKIKNKEKYIKLINSFKKKTLIKSLLRKIYIKISIRIKKDYIIKKYGLLKLKNKTNNLIKANMINLLKKKIIFVKYFKYFLRNIFKSMDDKYYKDKLKNLYNNYLKKSSFKKIDECVKNKNLMYQIYQLNKLKNLTKIFKSIKKNYMNAIKYKIIKQNYEKHSIISFFKTAISCLLNKNKK